MKTYLYIITNISMPDICKVGVTNDVEKRLRDLNKTSMPTRFQVYEEFALENAEVLEQRILQPTFCKTEDKSQTRIFTSTSRKGV